MDTKNSTDKSGGYVLEPGERVYTININNGEVKEAKYIVIIIDRKRKRILKEKEGFIHIPALNKGHAKKKFDKIIEATKKICSACGGENRNLVMCERCGNNHCNDCQAEYNQHTQIDFNCCKTCAKGYE